MNRKIIVDVWSIAELPQTYHDISSEEGKKLPYSALPDRATPNTFCCLKSDSTVFDIKAAVIFLFL